MCTAATAGDKNSTSGPECNTETPRATPGLSQPTHCYERLASSPCAPRQASRSLSRRASVQLERHRSPVLTITRTRALEAIPAIHGLITARLKRHFGGLSALAASRLEHLAAATARRSAAAHKSAAARPALSLAGRAAFGTTVRLILKALAREELLLAGTKNKLAVTVDAAQCFISIHVRVTPGV